MTDRASLANTVAVILAAGQGTRMKSALPKVLHTIAGRPLVFFPVRAALDAGCSDVIVVVGHGRGDVEAYLRATFGDRVKTAIQAEQRGTGDAARAALVAIRPNAQRVLVFYGDVPLLTADDLAPVAHKLDTEPDATLALATCSLAEPFGYGRVLRNASGYVVAIREQKDLGSDDERACTEINPGIYASCLSFLRDALSCLKPNNAQGELYLTDIVAYAAGLGLRVAAVPSRADVLAGVNDRRQLIEAETTLLGRIADRWRLAGVTVRAGARIDDGVELAPDAVIETGVVLRGKTRVGPGAIIDVGCVLTNVLVDDGAVLKPYSVLTDSTVGARAQVGPFAHLRPDSHIAEDSHVGNFVELKKTTMAKGAKANHLAYLGDGIIGEGANIGAGTIFCNYDGFLKHTTVIEKGAFIGSDSQLVAPVTVGEGAYVGTGTTVTRDVPKDALALSRVRQENKEGYAAKLRAKLKAAKAAQHR